MRPLFTRCDSGFTRLIMIYVPLYDSCQAMEKLYLIRRYTIASRQRKKS